MDKEISQQVDSLAFEIVNLFNCIWSGVLSTHCDTSCFLCFLHGRTLRGMQDIYANNSLIYLRSGS